ncbi:MAG: CHAD domain-containing protein [Acidobacteria bacterium]|nr:CHAD domain-containing protein [Acidobacteriota bacterium]
MKWDDKLTLDRNLRVILPEVAREWHDTGQKAIAPGTTWDDMHDFRLHTKRMRYTLELFRPAYGPGLDKHLKSLRKLQQLLGRMNDTITTHALLAERPEFDALLPRLDRRAARQRVEVRAYWRRNFADEAPASRWIDYLARGIKRRPAGSS